MSEPVLLLLSAGAGAVIGMLYFTGLWLTVRRLKDARNPALLTFGSFVGRTATAIFLFYLIVREGHWGLGVAALAGFVLSRIFVMRLLKKRSSLSASSAHGGEA
jgi:F1F0 ATPase subunit 2